MMAELPKATFDGTTLTIGDPQTVPQGQYKTRVSVGTKYAFVYSSNTTLNEFIGVVPGQYWFELPSSINKRNTTQIKSYVTSVLNAPEPVSAPVNVDDSYSLRDIADFKTNVANVSIAGNHDWIDENTVKLSTNTIFQFAPKNGWAASIDSDGVSLIVLPGENYTTVGRNKEDNLVSLIALQFVAQDGSVDVYRGEFKKASPMNPIAYYGAYTIGEWVTLETWEQPAYSTYSHGYIIELRQSPVNEITNEGGTYFVRRILPWNDTGKWSNAGTPQGGFENLEDAQTAFNEQKAEAENAAVVAAEEKAREDEEAKRGKVIGTETLTAGRFHNRAGESIVYHVRYVKEGKYSVTADGLVIGVFDAPNDETAVADAGPLIRAWNDPERPAGAGDGSMWVLILSILGVAAVIGLIVWVRSREAE